ncbi:MAG: hypothetical protein AB1757_07540 [Acidobacteriota bacterium]
MKLHNSTMPINRRADDCLKQRRRNLRRQSLTAGILVLFVALVTSSAAQQPIRIRTSELERMPLVVGSLKFTFAEFRGSFMKLGNGSVEAQVENTGTGFTTFSPQKLSFVGSDNTQVDVLAIQSGDKYWPAVERNIAPSAHLKEFYALNGKVRLPARIYYDEKLLAVIVD